MVENECVSEQVQFSYVAQFKQPQATLDMAANTMHAAVTILAFTHVPPVHKREFT